MAGDSKIFYYDWPRKRLYFYGRQFHHGLAGVIAVVGGIGLILHDWADKWWMHESP